MSTEARFTKPQKKLIKQLKEACLAAKLDGEQTMDALLSAMFEVNCKVKYTDEALDLEAQLLMALATVIEAGAEAGGDICPSCHIDEIADRLRHMVVGDDEPAVAATHAGSEVTH
jgi:hypothetical protein